MQATEGKSSSPSIFREAALTKIRSPDQLDTLLPVTSPLGWLALLTAGIALAVVLIWGFTGTIMRTATGQGIIVRNGDLGIMSIGGMGTGAVQEIMVQLGDEVKKGQPLFKLDLPLLRAQLANAQATLTALLDQDAMQSRSEEDRLKILVEKMMNQESLYGQGLLTKSPLLETKTSIYTLQAPRFSRMQQILDQRAKIQDLETRLAQEEIVRAPYAGEVIEVDVNIGDYAQPGRVLARLQSLTGNPEAIVYVPAGEGKKIRPGMTIRISPSTVRPEEYGYIQGRVRRMSLFPISREIMMGVLGNDTMVNHLQQNGEAIMLSATLDLDPSTPSGFRWSSSRGPDVSVEGGTLCNASIVLERHRPITLLMPFLKKQLGLY